MPPPVLGRRRGSSSTQQKRVLLFQTEAPEEETPVIVTTPLEPTAGEPLPRRLARGFTITVSPPAEFGPAEEPTEGQAAAEEVASSVGESIPEVEEEEYEDLLPRRRTMIRESEDYLAPEEPVPSVTLDHTLSRLPSLEDMLADEELRKMLNTSPMHREVQEMILVEDEKKKYDNIMALVEKSYKDPGWRTVAAADKALIDTLVLLCRQRLGAAQNPHVAPGADFMPRRMRSFASSNSRAGSFSRSPTITSSDGLGPRLSESEAIAKSATHLALVSATVKLLRNLCVQAKECQIYLHEHRLIDLLFEHIDLIMEVVHVARNEPTMIPSEAPSCPDWVIAEIDRFPRSLIQLITNVVSGNLKIQTHILQHIFPHHLLNAIILSGDADLLFCLLHCIMAQQPTDTLHDFLLQDADGVKVLYFLLAYTTLGASQGGRKSAADEPPLLAAQSSRDTLPEWATAFFTGLCRRPLHIQQEPTSFVGEILEQLVDLDPSRCRVAPSKTLRHAASFHTPSGGSTAGAESRRGSCDVPLEWLDFVGRKVRHLLEIPKAQTLGTYLDIVDAVVDAEGAALGKASSQPKPAVEADTVPATASNGVDILAQATRTLRLLYTYIQAGLTSTKLKATDELRPRQTSDATITDTATEKQDQLDLLRNLLPRLLCIAVSLSAALAPLVDKRQHFNAVFGLPLLDVALEALKRPACPCPKDLLLLLANVCHRSPDAQNRLAERDGVRAILTHCRMDPDEPLKREAAVFALKNGCRGSVLNQTALRRLLTSDEFKAARATIPPDDIIRSP